MLQSTHLAVTGSGSTSPAVAGAADVTDLSRAAATLVCEWSSKLLKEPFADLEQLARHLVSKQCVSGCSAAAVFTLMAAGGGDQHAGEPAGRSCRGRWHGGDNGLINS